MALTFTMLANRKHVKGPDSNAFQGNWHPELTAKWNFNKSPTGSSIWHFLAGYFDKQVND